MIHLPYLHMVHIQIVLVDVHMPHIAKYVIASHMHISLENFIGA
jgi:hypothetical protein